MVAHGITPERRIFRGVFTLKDLHRRSLRVYSIIRIG
jgi:hypothetical protein